MEIAVEELGGGASWTREACGFSCGTSRDSSFPVATEETARKVEALAFEATRKAVYRMGSLPLHAEGYANLVCREACQPRQHSSGALPTLPAFQGAANPASVPGAANPACAPRGSPSLVPHPSRPARKAQLWRIASQVVWQQEAKRIWRRKLPPIPQTPAVQPPPMCLKKSIAPTGVFSPTVRGGHHAPPDSARDRSGRDLRKR